MLVLGTHDLGAVVGLALSVDTSLVPRAAHEGTAGNTDAVATEFTALTFCVCARIRDALPITAVLTLGAAKHVTRVGYALTIVADLTGLTLDIEA